MSRPNAGERGGMDILTVEGLSKSFAGLSALRDVSLSLRAGEIRAICGENGAGKSTLVKLLMGILAPDAGAITIDGRSEEHTSELQSLRHIVCRLLLEKKKSKLTGPRQ